MPQVNANLVYSRKFDSIVQGVTPDTDYVIEGSQYAVPLGHKFAPIEDYQKDYRGLLTFWKFDRSTGRIDRSGPPASWRPSL